ncbi:MAG: tryptophan synthase subunit alpha [Desulfobacterales bacterium]|nr:tryptophan synthase subunit alpha [Desulfobacterales bacterium]
MNRIDLLFKRLKREGKKALIPFITAGDPDLGTTRDLVFALEECGAHIIELGVPFSDPLADGPVIQAASLRALRQGTDLKKILVLVEEIRRGTDIALILMTYYNPVYRFGLGELTLQASMAGVDGFIIPDLPPEEAAEWSGLARANNLDVIFLVAPNTPLSRARSVARKTSGFLYTVSVTGITGKRKGIPEGLADYLKMLRTVTDKPLAVGFGISSASQVKEIGALCEGVIIGSALVDSLAHYGDKKDAFIHIRSFVSSLAKALTGNHP